MIKCLIPSTEVKLSRKLPITGDASLPNDGRSGCAGRTEKKRIPNIPIQNVGMEIPNIDPTRTVLLAKRFGGDLVWRATQTPMGMPNNDEISTAVSASSNVAGIRSIIRPSAGFEY